jgi:hypothetical protein
MLPTGNTEYQVGIGNLFRVYNDAFTLESIGSIATSFGNGALIDLGKGWQNNIILMICYRI